jgi:hypothetical protein
MGAVRSGLATAAMLAFVGWFNAARSAEAGSNPPSSSTGTQQSAWGTTGNPTIAPLKWAGLVLNYEAHEKDGKKYSRACTGQFISPRVVLTAAHCVQDTDTGGWYDLQKMYFLAQYQNNTFSRSYRAVCASRFDGWWPPQLRSQDPEEKNRAGQSRWQWDYAMILVDRDSATGHYKNWVVDWQGKYSEAGNLHIRPRHYRRGLPFFIFSKVHRPSAPHSPTDSTRPFVLKSESTAIPPRSGVSSILGGLCTPMCAPIIWLGVAE